MTLEEAVDIHIANVIHNYNKNGAYVGYGYELRFDIEKHNKLFSFSYEDPKYKVWLMNNATLHTVKGTKKCKGGNTDGKSKEGQKGTAAEKASKRTKRNGERT